LFAVLVHEGRRQMMWRFINAAILVRPSKELAMENT
jgi:hypothetical protein